MKKIISIIGLMSVLGFLAVPLFPASAIITEAATSCTMKYNLTSINAACDVGDTPLIEDNGMCCVMNSIYNITDWIFVILVGVAGIMVLFGAYTLLTAAGASEKVTSGRQYIIYAAVGLAVAFLAKAIPGVVKIIVGLK